MSCPSSTQCPPLQAPHMQSGTPVAKGALPSPSLTCSHLLQVRLSTNTFLLNALVNDRLRHAVLYLPSTPCCIQTPNPHQHACVSGGTPCIAGLIVAQTQVPRKSEWSLVFTASCLHVCIWTQSCRLTSSREMDPLLLKTELCLLPIESGFIFRGSTPTYKPHA